MAQRTLKVESVRSSVHASPVPGSFPGRSPWEGVREQAGGPVGQRGKRAGGGHRLS